MLSIDVDGIIFWIQKQVFSKYRKCFQLLTE